MSRDAPSTYDTDAHIAEIYDQLETQVDDVELIRRLISGQGRLRILEPFCGTGRILIPLAADGHEIVGLDQARGMLDRARMKVARLSKDEQARVTLAECDVTVSEWPRDFDVVILGGNCFYELATPEEQRGCLASAAAALRPGGHVYVDNEHMEGELDKRWRSGVQSRFPTGVCADGTRVEGIMVTEWWDAQRRLVRFRRKVTVTFLDGTTRCQEWIQQKHPPSAVEVRTWLEKHGFAIGETWGDRSRHPYTDESPRAIFWATKQHK